MTTIPDAAIQAAARAFCGIGWDHVESGHRAVYLESAEEALSAAILHLTHAQQAEGDEREDALLPMLHAQREWSRETFGPGDRLHGVVDHIRKELDEVLAAPQDVTEWIDVVILALDGAWRAGHEPEKIVAALRAKYAKNRARSWPDWRTAPEGQAIEHIAPSPTAIPARLLSGEHVGREVVLPDGETLVIDTIEHGEASSWIWASNDPDDYRVLAPSDVVELVQDGDDRG